MTNFLTWLSRRRFPYEPLITVEISRSRLIHNLNEFQKIAPQNRVSPVLKSNAYGHGLLEVAGILETYRNSDAESSRTIPFFAVDSYFEAVSLRSHGIRTPLLIIGYTRPETILSSRLRDVSYSISSLESLLAMKGTTHAIAIHLKMDTGMHRQGLVPEETHPGIRLIKSNSLIRLEGLCSHLCDSDNDDPAFTMRQISLWNEVAALYKTEFPSIKYFHLSATDGHHYTNKIEANLSRLGLGLYGITEKSPSPKASEDHWTHPEMLLKPVMEMKTIITGIKTLRKGESIGYGNIFKAPQDMTIATIPVGYYEGVDRRLSNIGSVEVGPRHIPCPIIGRVSMNITSIDISQSADAKIGHAIKVISHDPAAENSIISIAKKCQSVPYEVVIHIPAHLKRVMVG